MPKILGGKFKILKLKTLTALFAINLHDNRERKFLTNSNGQKGKWHPRFEIPYCIDTKNQ